MGEFVQASESERDEADKEGQPRRPKPTAAALASQKSASSTQFAREKYGDAFSARWESAHENAPAPKDDDPFGGGKGRKPIDGKAPMQGGYGLRLHDAASGAARAKTEKAPIAVPAKPVLEFLEQGIAAQRRASEQVQPSRTESAVRLQERMKAYAREWITENETTLMRYEFEQSSACTSFNSWAALANAANVALQDIVETARLLGFDVADESQAAAFVLGLESSVAMANQLVDEKMLGVSGAQSWSTRNDDATASSAAHPELRGTELSPRFEDVGSAYREVQNAYAHVYEGLLRDREQALQGEAGAVRSEIASVDAVIQFWVALADDAERSASAVGHAGPAAEHLERRASRGRLDGSYSLGQAKQAASRWETVHGAENHIEAHTRSREYEAQHDARVQLDREQRQAGTSSAGITAAPQMPTISVGKIVEFGLNAVFSSKLDALNKKLTGIEVQANATRTAVLFVNTRRAVDAFDGAAKNLEQRLQGLSTHALQERQQDFMNLGHELDRYALEHASHLQRRGKHALVPGKGKEIHATTMAVLAKIEQYRALSAMSLQTFDYDGFLAAARQQQLERSAMKRPAESASRSHEKTVERVPPLPHMAPAEIGLYQHIGGTYLRVLQDDEQWRIRLGRVAQGASALLRKLEGNGASPDTVGRRF
jgi:hypothetical protein